MNIEKVSYALMLTVCASTLSAAGSPSLVAPLLKQKAIQGCSWNAVAPSVGNGYIFLAEWDESKVLMNIDGQDVELQVTADADKRPSKRNAMVKTYLAPGIEVRATYTVTWDCSQSDNESCEVTRYDALYEVRKGDRHQTIKASGEVGC